MNGHQIISKYTQHISNCCWYLLGSFGCFASWTPFSILKLHWALESMLWSEAWAAKPGWFANHGHTVIHVIRVIGLIQVRTLSSWWSVGVCVSLCLLTVCVWSWMTIEMMLYLDIFGGWPKLFHPETAILWNQILLLRMSIFHTCWATMPLLKTK